VPGSAFAQYIGRDKPHSGTLEVGGGIVWNTGYAAGSASANETRNPTTGSAPLPLFQTVGRLESAPGLYAQLGVYVTPRWSIEGGVQVSRPKLTVRASNDFEGAVDQNADETLTRYLVDGSAVYQVASFAKGRAAPFVLGGGGYTRELDAGNAIVQTGNEIHGGGGLRYWFGSGARRVALRVEGRVSSRTGAASLEDTTKRRIMYSASAGIVWLF
jgi:hypothetical protein